MNTGNLYAIIGMDPKEGIVADSGEELVHRLILPFEFTGELVDFMGGVNEGITQARIAFMNEFKFSPIDESSSLYLNLLDHAHLDGMMNIGEIMSSFSTRNRYNMWLYDGRMEYGGDDASFSTYFRELESLFKLIEQEGDQRKQERTRITVRNDENRQDQLLDLDNRPLPRQLSDLHSRILTYNTDRYQRIALGHGIAQGMRAMA